MKPYVAIGSRNRTLLTGFGVLHSYMRKVPGTECQIEKVLDAANGYEVNLCHHTEDRKRIRILMEKEVREGKYTQNFFDVIDKEYKDDLKGIKAFSKEDFSKLDNKKLIEYFNIFYEIYISTIHPMVLGIYASDLQDVFENELKNILKDEATLENMIKYTALFLTPTRLTTVQKEEQALFELQSDPENDKALDDLVESFGWFHMEYIGEPRTKEEYQRQLQERIESPKQRLQDIIKEQRDFLEKNKDYQNLDFFKKLVFMMQEYQIVLDFSKADLIEGIYYARPLLLEIGERVGLPSWIDVRFLAPDEIREFLRSNTKVNFEYIQERKKHWACLLEDGKITAYYGDDAVKIMDRLIEKPDTTLVKEFKGLTAYPGIVRGTACIIKGAGDRNKFKQGQIMVTYDTTTELTSIIKIASAIVADYGSLLSHTAIVSREFKIPCIVSTKVGTKLVKDGDLLEVDAAKGIVKILN
ncbi:MAG: PEP-utilizing enzyme [Patescibacteria group bacterium]